MKYFFSLLERKSFTKIFSLLLVSFILLTGFAYAQEDENSVILTTQAQIDKLNSFNIFPPKKITLIYAYETKELLTYSNSVQEVLEEYNIYYSDDDIIFPSLDFETKDTNLIKITLVNKEVFEDKEPIPYEIVLINDGNLNYGDEIIEQKGEEGIERVLYEDVYKNGVYIKTEIHESEILKEPVNEIVRVGTQTSAIGGNNCPYWDSVIEKSTNNNNEQRILKSLIRCESNCNDAKNNRGKYLGLLQFSKSTFYHYGGKDIWNGQQQILASINILRAGGLSHHWPACSRNIY